MDLTYKRTHWSNKDKKPRDLLKEINTLREANEKSLEKTRKLTKQVLEIAGQTKRSLKDQTQKMQEIGNGISDIDEHNEDIERNIRSIRSIAGSLLNKFLSLFRRRKPKSSQLVNEAERQKLKKKTDTIPYSNTEMGKRLDEIDSLLDSMTQETNEITKQLNIQKKLVKNLDKRAHKINYKTEDLTLQAKRLI